MTQSSRAGVSLELWWENNFPTVLYILFCLLEDQIGFSDYNIWKRMKLELIQGSPLPHLPFPSDFPPDGGGDGGRKLFLCWAPFRSFFSRLSPLCSHNKESLGLITIWGLGDLMIWVLPPLFSCTVTRSTATVACSTSRTGCSSRACPGPSSPPAPCPRGSKTGKTVRHIDPLKFFLGCVISYYWFQHNLTAQIILHSIGFGLCLCFTKYWAQNYYSLWVVWNWVKKIAFTCLQWVNKPQINYPISRNP